MDNLIVDIDQSNAKAMLIDESFRRPVMIDFWADWCSPCKTLFPVLQKLVEEAAGGFLLAKINVDQEQGIAAQFGIQSMPTVVIMKDGQPVDGFVGVQPEKEIRAMLDKYLPKPWEQRYREGLAALEQENFVAAIAALRETCQMSGDAAEHLIALAEAYIGAKRLTEAREVLAGIRLKDQDQAYEQALAQLELAENAQKAPELTLLEERHAAAPDDQDVAYELAVQYNQAGYQREALELLLSLLRKDLGMRDGEVRRTFTDVLAVLGKSDPLAAQYQRQLYSLIY